VLGGSGSDGSLDKHARALNGSASGTPRQTPDGFGETDGGGGGDDGRPRRRRRRRRAASDDPELFAGRSRTDGAARPVPANGARSQMARRAVPVPDSAVNGTVQMSPPVPNGNRGFQTQSSITIAGGRDICYGNGC